MTVVDALQTITLEEIVTELVEVYGFEGLGQRVPLPCFEGESSLISAVEFLRATPRARARVERAFLFHLRERRGRDARERDNAKDVRGAAAAVVQATKGVTSVVQDMHTAIGAFPIITDLAYAAVKGVTGLVGVAVEAVVPTLAPLLGDSAPGPEREAVLAALNGVVGDHLVATGNALAIQMSLRPPLCGLHDGGTLLVLVHGSCMNDLQWTRAGHDHGRALLRDFGLTPAYAHYNSGLHTSTNGYALATLLETESAPFRDIIMLGHSMGGLVARAAIHVAEKSDQPRSWRSKLGALVTLGTPHHGAPLERGGNVFETWV